MSHIDKGALHAHLDGALDEYSAAEAARIRDHLDTCGACSELLAVERAVRSDASRILGYASPEVDLPTLEELRAYVKTTRPAPRPAAVRMYRMGWAASVVLALGAGWMVRDGQVAPLRQNDGGFTSSVVTEAEVPGSGPIESADRLGSANAGTGDELIAQGALDDVVDRDMAESDPPALKVSEPTTPAPQSRVLDERELRSVTMVDAAAGAVREEVAGNEPIAPGRVAGAGESADEEVDGLAVVAFDAQAVEAVPPPEVSAELMGGQDAAADLVATAPVLERALDSVEAQAEPEEEAPKEELAESRSADSPVPVTSAFASGARRSRQDALDNERNFYDEPALAIPGYEVLTITSLGEGSTPVGVHVVQRIDGAVTVELFRLRPGFGPDVLPALGEGRRELRAETTDGWIVLRGALTEVQLNILLVSLFPN
jgi:hypothetical protein